MKNLYLAIISITSLGVASCNGGNSPSNGDNTQTLQTSKVSIDGKSSFSIPLQNSPSSTSLNNTGSNFCYTIDKNNVLYFYNQACSPSIMSNDFESINLTLYGIQNNTPVFNSASDNAGNIYIGSYGNSSSLLKCNINTKLCNTLNVPSYSSGSTTQLINDSFGNLYFPAHKNGYNASIIQKSTDTGATWQNVEYNLDGLDTIYGTPISYALMYNPKTNQVVDSIAYKNRYGEQFEFWALQAPNGNLWSLYSDDVLSPDLMVDKQYDGAMAISNTGYTYIADRVNDGGGSRFYYFNNNQWINFTVDTPERVPSSATVFSMTFDSQNNIYITYSTGQTFWAKAPI